MIEANYLPHKMPHNNYGVFFINILLSRTAAKYGWWMMFDGNGNQKTFCHELHEFIL